MQFGCSARQLNDSQRFPGLNITRRVTSDGDKINALLAGAGHNYRLVLQWLRNLLAQIMAALFEGTGRGPLGLTGEDIDALFGPTQTGSPAGP